MGDGNFLVLPPVKKEMICATCHLCITATRTKTIGAYKSINNRIVTKVHRHRRPYLKPCSLSCILILLTAVMSDLMPVTTEYNSSSWMLMLAISLAMCNVPSSILWRRRYYTITVCNNRLTRALGP